MDAPSPLATPAVAAALTTEGPLGRDTALELLRYGDELMAAGEYARAAQAYSRVSGFDDPAVTGAAWLGLGDAYYRLDHEREALGAWEAVLQLPETRSSYRAWRNIAAARVRAGDLREAIEAYREAERRAPLEDKPEIASRLGWLAKETGNAGAARRYFARSRGDVASVPLSYLILGLTVIVSFVAMSSGSQDLLGTLMLDKQALAHGELYRLWSVTLVHAGLIHLLFNMYALYLLGPLVEGIWGSGLFLLFYLLTAAAASTASFIAGPTPAVGASGAVFGLVGVLMAGTRAHNPVLDRRARAIIPQLGTIVLINLVFGFLAGGQIDNAAHIGGLVAGLWLGLVVPPGRVPTLRSMWQRPAGSPASNGAISPLIVIAGVVALVAVILFGLSIGGIRLG
jgi:membrane associated rhomboid family serine protease